MNKVILDASALLALLNQEKGYDMVEAALPYAIMSTVNFSEVAAVLLNTGLLQGDIKPMMQELIKEVIPFDQNQAFIAAALRKTTKTWGLSFGDRACLSLAKYQQLSVLTADKVWSKLGKDIDIQIIR